MTVVDVNHVYKFHKYIILIDFSLCLSEFSYAFAT